MSARAAVGGSRRARLLVLLAVIVAVALGAPLAGTPAPAHADAAGSLTIRKTLGEGDTPGRPLEGIRFDVRLVEDVPLADAAALAALAASDPALLGDGAGHPLGVPVEAVTDVAGEARATGLADGVYVVRELPSRVGDVAYSVISPFLIAIGLDGERDVVVQAKNQALGVSLSASAETVSPGDAVSVTIAGSVPAPDRNGRLHRYVLAIRSDALLESPAIGAVWIDAGDASETLAEGVDYVVTWSGDGRVARIELTSAGLERLARIRAARPDARVLARLDGVVAADARDGDRLRFEGALYADGWPAPDSPEAAVDGGIPANEVAIRVVVPATPCPECTPATVPPAPGPGGPLASTGGLLDASLLALGGGGLLLGLVLLRRRRRERDEDEQMERMSASEGAR